MCENIPCLYAALSIPQPPWMYLAEALVHRRKVGRAVLTAPSKAGVHAALFHLGKGGHTHSLWETVSAEAGVNWLFNNKQAQGLLFYYFYAYGAHAHLVWWDYCLRLPQRGARTGAHWTRAGSVACLNEALKCLKLSLKWNIP